ncbi:OmpW/AlkL family protein [Acinetobacter sp. A47]|uniref:OmpW/AlkL family protein n=1 Tax=Acinetobacter sp. A47 TaxID=1561217 RepID=UPI000570E52C|nr:OmpW family outer membrane protein [Acinetobacter sp. A47]
MQKPALKIATLITLMSLTQFTCAQEFKKYSVSAGWFHIMPQGSANPINVNANIKNPAGLAEGIVNRYGMVDSWQEPEAGLEVKKVDSIGLTFNYYLNDKVSLQLIGGIPPKVDLKGKGDVSAPLSEFNLASSQTHYKQSIPITNLGNRSKAATVRAWTPAIEVQYQFGRSGVDKFRPYLGAGLMYAHLNQIKLNEGIRSDLISAGHMMQNILDLQGGAGLDQKVARRDMAVKIVAEDAIAPVVTAGFTYDFNDSWYGIGSVSYAKLNNQATIDVVNNATGTRLIHATTKIDMDPVTTYFGLGYRF